MVDIPEPTLLTPLHRAVTKFARRLDGWVNTVTGLGGMLTDRAASSRFESGCIPDALTIDAIYTHDWLADRIIEKMPSIALVRGFTVEGAEDSDELVRDFEALNTSVRFPTGAFQKAVYDGRAYGCAGLFLGYKLGDPLEPVEPESEIARGGLAFLDVVAQHELHAVTRYVDPSSPKFGMPEIYEILGTSNGIPHPRQGQRFHESRLLRFIGKPLRTGRHPLGNFPELGVSVLTNVMADISRYGTSWAAVSHLLQDASIGVMKMGGLIEALASDDKAIVEDRLSVLQRTKSLNRLMFLDADAGEEFSRVAVSFADLPGVMAQIILSISGAADMPAKILFGTSPMGLNANSAGLADLEQFYNSVDEYRRRIIGPSLETVLRAISGNANVRVRFPALWQPSENEQAQTRLTNANATRAYWDMGAVQAKDIVRAVKEGVQPEAIGTPTEEPDPDPDGEGGGGPQGAPGRDLAGELASEGRTDSVEFTLAEQMGYEEVSEEELRELIAAGAREVVVEFVLDAKAAGKGKMKAAGTRSLLTGPRGGTYYITASGRKVYTKKRPEGSSGSRKKRTPEEARKKRPEGSSGSRKKRTPEEARKARNERAKQRRAEKKQSEADEQLKRLNEKEQQKLQQERERQQAAQKRIEQAHEASRARGGPQTRAEAENALRQHVENLHIGNWVRDHEVVNAYHALKEAGIDKIYGPGNRLRNLVLGATPVDRGPARKGDHGTIDTIPSDAGGLYSSPQIHGQGYIKVSRYVRDTTPEEREARRRYGEAPASSAPLGSSNHKVDLQDQNLTRVLVHEFGHAVHLEQAGPYPRIDAVVRRAYNENRRPVSGYGETNHLEYFAESFVAYRYRREELKQSAPGAYNMVQEVLRLRGIES